MPLKPSSSFRLSVVAGATVAVVAAMMPVTAVAQTPGCTAPTELTRLDQPLRRLAQRIAARQAITIVAIGSSSTTGAGATSSAASYPSRLEVELKERFPHIAIKVLNRGVNGEEAADMLARFDKAVIAEQPDLVLWQLGTNALLRHSAIGPVGALIHEGLDRLKATGADVILMNPQFAPRVFVPETPEMNSLIETSAKSENVSVFRRYDVMRHWKETQGIPFETFLSPDGLHMNDWSYACVARILAGTIDEAATRATAVAGGRPRL
jgi:acyl-CoA thioesterase-1